MNYVVPLTDAMATLVGLDVGTSVTVRERRADALPVVIRTWNDEARILQAVGEALPHVPRCLAEADGVSIHSYVEGMPLSSVTQNGKPVDTVLVKALAGLLAGMAQVRRGRLPSLPSVWPSDDKDSQGFLRTLAHLADRQIRQPNRPAFGGLFAALGIPEDALTRLAERVPAMARRPYSLLHADLHRDNLIMAYDGLPPLICVDWELATYGDPLHDLATHLVRMRYPAHQWAEVVDAWADAMQWIRPAAVSGLARDLGHYVAFERAQSVYPDVMRAARSLEGPITQKNLDAATAEVRRALEDAAEPLRLRNIPSEYEIERALFRWRAARGHGGIDRHGGIDGRDGSGGGDGPRSGDGARGGDGSAEVFGWRPDHRLPEHPGFPAAAVREALLAEGSAPAGRVFKGTAHLNTVVPGPDGGPPVVVRRRLTDAGRRERGFFPEHAVLRAIEDAGVAVAVPRVLALGECSRGDPVAIHTYVGPRDIETPPGHPVHGLLPHEADGLVDQLAALTGVGHRQIDPAAGDGRFFEWLTSQLVELVGDLPKPSQRLARFVGLPAPGRLHQLLSGHRMSERKPSLLHGDLGPRHLVRRDDHLAVTLVSWDRALIGDPLYDLVRHMHLTPTRPEIRDRMIRRWQRGLPGECTGNWEEDWRTYRGIEIVRSAYVDLDRLLTRADRNAPDTAAGSFAMTLAAATAFLGLPARPPANPYLARLLA
ncbi:phosphotransferase family protein [Streptomyces sp. NPDC059010]|uniref:phosphotransferase family protein n=1 Tax=Streptomyces sp. NPDC059010 TaxID=3346695 RepID=UPI0036929F37